MPQESAEYAAPQQRLLAEDLLKQVQQGMEEELRQMERATLAWGAWRRGQVLWRAALGNCAQGVGRLRRQRRRKAKGWWMGAVETEQMGQRGQQVQLKLPRERQRRQHMWPWDLNRLGWRSQFKPFPRRRRKRTHCF